MSSKRLDRLGDWLLAYVESGRMAGASVAIVRQGRVVYMGAAGYADLARNVPMRFDTLVRIKSMTKPLTSSLAMMLFEEGEFQLDDPIVSHLPCFTDMRVAIDGPWDRLRTVAARREISFRHLLTHTGGLTYGFIGQSPVDELYRRHHVDFQLDSPLREGPPTDTLEAMVQRAATMPLLSHPGERWNYSISTDILGRLIEVITGMPLANAMEARLFAPLGMNDTSFTVPDPLIERFAAHYGLRDGQLMEIDNPQTSRWVSAPSLHSGGGGVVSTVPDYMRFCMMLLGRGRFNDNQLLGRKTVDLMTSNHLPGEASAYGTPFQGDEMPGQGFGLGFAITLDPSRRPALGSKGDFGWNGSASTTFWIDPSEQLIVVFSAQLTPDWAYPFRDELRSLVYQSLVS